MKTSIRIVLFLLFVFASYQVTFGQVTQEWVKKYGRVSTTSDDTYGIALDISGNIYVVGTCNDLGTSNDMAIIKYNPNGDTLWVRRYNGTANGYDASRKVALDGNGNIYVTGYSAGSGTGNDFTTIKYNSNGDPLWARTYNGPGNSDDVANYITIDASNNIIVTGYSTGNGTGYDIATLKYNTNGVLQWQKRYNCANFDDYGSSLATDALQNIYVTGPSRNTGTGPSDYVTIKYNSVGDTLWVKRYNGLGNGDDQSRALKIDITGNVLVTGYSAGSSSGTDFLTIKYNSSNGDSIWVKRFNGPANGSDDAKSIGVDNLGNVFVGGTSAGSGTGNDFAVIKYYTNGDFAWTQRFNYGTNDQLYHMVLDSVGSVYLAGQVGSSPFFNEYRFGAAKYNSYGNLIWSDIWYGGGSGQDYYASGSAIAVKGPHYVYISGGTRISYQNDWATFKYSQQFMIKCLVEGFYDSGSNSMLPDTINVQLRSTIFPYPIVDSAKVKINTQGIGYYRLYNAPYGSYYIVSKHRNSIETWSPAIFPFNETSYDFTTAASQAYGNNQVLKGTKYCMYSGDVNQDGAIEASDLMIVDNAAFLGLGGYIPPDVNGDFFVDGSDMLIVDNNSTGFIGIVRP